MRPFRLALVWEYELISIQVYFLGTLCYDPLFYLQINSKALWKWPEFKMDLTQIFHALQDGLASIAYKLNLSRKVCVRTAVKGRVHHVMKRVTSETNGKKRKNFRS